MKRGWFLLFTLSVLLVFSGAANADLITIGTATYGSSDYNLIYEDDQGLVWLDYTNGRDIWQNQVDWASGLGGSLTVNLNPEYTTTINWSSGWRLPSAGDNPQNGFNQTTSEMGHLYYESLGKLAGGPLGDTDPFDNLVDDHYWTGTESFPGANHVWDFYFYYGYQGSPVYKDSINFALAVRPGEVSVVPEPATMLLVCSGILGLAGFRRAFKKS